MGQKRHTRREGFNVLYILAPLALFVLSVFLISIYRSQERKAEIARQEQESARKAERVRQLMDKREQATSILGRWDDALRLAGMTSRIALAQPIARMMDVRREMSEMKVGECFDKGSAQIVAGMSDAIFAFEMFVRFPNNNSASESTSKYLSTSINKVEAGRSGIDECVEAEKASPMRTQVEVQR